MTANKTRARDLPRNDSASIIGAGNLPSVSRADFDAFLDKLFSAKDDPEDKMIIHLEGKWWTVRELREAGCTVEIKQDGESRKFKVTLPEHSEGAGLNPVEHEQSK